MGELLRGYFSCNFRPNSSFMIESARNRLVSIWPGVDFISPFMLCAKLLRSAPSSYALRQNFKKASQKFGAERKSFGQSVNGFMKSTPACFQMYQLANSQQTECYHLVTTQILFLSRHLSLTFSMVMWFDYIISLFFTCLNKL